MYYLSSTRTSTKEAYIYMLHFYDILVNFKCFLMIIEINGFARFNWTLQWNLFKADTIGTVK